MTTIELDDDLATALTVLNKNKPISHSIYTNDALETKIINDLTGQLHWAIKSYDVTTARAILNNVDMLILDKILRGTTTADLEQLISDYFITSQHRAYNLVALLVLQRQSHANTVKQQLKEIRCNLRNTRLKIAATNIISVLTIIAVLITMGHCFHTLSVTTNTDQIATPVISLALLLALFTMVILICSMVNQTEFDVYKEEKQRLNNITSYTPEH